MGSKQPVRDVGDPLLYTYAEAQIKLGISESQLYKLMRDKEIKSLALGPQVRRIPLSELEGYVARLMAEQFPEAAA